MSTQLSLKR